MSAYSSASRLPRVLGVVVSFHGLLLIILALAAHTLGHSAAPGISPNKRLAIGAGIALLVLGLLISFPRWVGYLPRIWDSYWFSHGGKYSLGIVRMAVAASLLLSGLFQIDFKAFVLAQDPELYQPQGILNLLGSYLPPAYVFEVMEIVALISTWLFLFGLATRLSGIFSFISCLILSSLEWSFTPFWCHGDNLPLLTQFIIILSPSGNTLSADAFLRRWLWKGPSDTTPGYMYRWPVLLAQWAAALMFLNGAWYKIKADDYHFGWALSDNLRHTLAMQHYYWIGKDPPSLPAWIMANEWHYKGAALGNLLSQTMPILACFFVRHPFLRAFFGSFFVLEVLGIGATMGIPGLGFGHFVLLYAAFIDWDRLILWLASRLEGGAAGSDRAEDAGTTAEGVWRKVIVSLFIFWFLEYFIYVAFTCPFCENKTYPFSSFSMYSDIKAKKPLDEHKSYETMLMEFEVKGSRIIPDHTMWGTRVTYSYLQYLSEPDEVRKGMLAMKSSLGDGIKRITLKNVIFQIPAYPDHPKPIPIYEGLVGSLGERQEFMCITAVSEWDVDAQQHYLKLRSMGYRNPHFRFGYMVDYTDLPPKPLQVSQKGDRYYYDRQNEGNHRFVIYVRDESLGDQEHVYLR
jgi:hypothetical protein